MNILQSFVIALSMYSKIPMPKVTWNEKNMKYAMCFFPVVGIVTGICLWLVGTLLFNSGCNVLFFGVIMTVLPVFINGGIHLDGFIDTMDALCSYGDREKKLEILKDPNTGAFAVIGLGIYLLLSVALWSEAAKEMLPVIACTYVLSRALSGLAVVWFPAAKDSGLARTFQDAAHRSRTAVFLVIYLIAAVVAMLILNPLMALGAILPAVLILIYYHYVCMSRFGGITGDLAGWFLQLCELGMLAGILVGGLL